MGRANGLPIPERVHGNGGPGEFADLAEKVGPAVIGVNAKVAAADDDDSSPGQSPGDSSGPDDLPDQDTPGRAVPNPGRRGPGNLPKLGEMTSIGSGFFISADGYAVTNNHVLGGSDRADVRTSDNKVYKAKVLGKDPVSDLALLKVDGRTDFSYVKLADQPPRTGDWVLAAGNSFGLGNTVTAGIVSARARDLETGSSEDFVQIDARINRGDSGGPSFNTHDDEIVGARPGQALRQVFRRLVLGGGLIRLLAFLDALAERVEARLVRIDMAEAGLERMPTILTSST